MGIHSCILPKIDYLLHAKYCAGSWGHIEQKYMFGAIMQWRKPDNNNTEL